jgi:primosomal protein N'
MMSTQTSFFFSDHFLSPEQQALVNRPIHGDTLFLEGAAGTGKTTVAAARLRHLLEQGVPAEEILILVPQRTHLEPFLSVLRTPRPAACVPESGNVPVLHGAHRRSDDRGRGF